MYRVYITDALKAIADNGTHHVTPGFGSADYGTSIKIRWADILQQKNTTHEQKQDDRTCEEIVTDMWARIKKGGG